MINKENQGRSLFSGVSVSLVAATLMGAVNYLTRRHLALNLSMIDFGFFYSAYSFFLILALLLDFGNSQALAILIPQERSKGKNNEAVRVFQFAIVFQLVANSIIAGILYFFSNWLAANYFRYPEGGDILRILLISLPVSAVFNCVLSLYAGIKDFFSRYVMLLIHGISVFVVTIVYTSSLELLAPAIAYLLAPIVVIALSVFRLMRIFPEILRPVAPTLRTTRKVVYFSFWTWISGAGLLFLNQCDTQMLTLLSGLQSVKVYNIALPVLQIFLVLLILPQVFMPIAAGLWVEKKLNEIRRLFNLLFELTIMGGGFITIFLFWGSKVIIGFLFSAAHADAAPVLAVFAVGLVFLLLSQFCIMLLNAIHQHRQVAKVVFGGVCFNILANYFLITKWNAVGAALATCLTHCGILAACFYMLVAKLKLRVPIGQIRPMVGALALIFGICSFLSHIWNWGELQTTITALGLYSCIIAFPLYKQGKTILSFFRG